MGLLLLMWAGQTETAPPWSPLSELSQEVSCEKGAGFMPEKGGASTAGRGGAYR